MRRLVILGMVFWCSAATGMTLEGHCDIRFEGSATFKEFSGSATSLPFRVEVPEAATNLQQVGDVTVIVRVKDLDTGHSLMNRRMYAMFEAERYPLITGRVVKDAEHGRALSLRIRDRERLVPVEVKRVERRTDSGTFDMLFTVSLDAFGLEAPTFMKVLRVHDKVHVKVHVRLRRLPLET